MMYHVMVYDHTSNKGNTSLTLADSAMMKMSKAKDYLTFTLYNGSNYQETNEMTYRDTSLALSRIDFTREELIIPLDNYTFEHSDSSRFGDQAKSMRMDQLKAQKDSLEKKNADAFDTHYSRMRNSSYFARRTQLDTARRGDITTFYESDKLLHWPTYEAVKMAYDRASSEAEP